METTPAIRLVVLDVDGVLTAGEGAPLDLRLMEQLSAMNRAARRGSGAAVTLCTGRPAPYVEALLQAIDGRVPAVFEGGAGLYVPDGYRFLPHPGLGDRAVLQECRRLLQAAAAGGAFFLQPGKEYTASVFPAALQDLRRLRKEVASTPGPLAAAVDLALSASCVNVSPRGCDKAAGLQFLADVTGIPTQAMLAVGDSEVDAPLLAAAGLAAAPANAAAGLKAAAAYVSPFAAEAAVPDILRHFALAR